MTTIFGETDIDVYRGDTANYTFSIMQDSVGYDFGGQTVFAQARSTVDSMFPIFDTRSSTGMAITDLSNGNDFNVGRVVLKITAAISKILPTHSRYDIRAQSGSDVTTLVSGNIVLKKDVSR